MWDIHFRPMSNLHLHLQLFSDESVDVYLAELCKLRMLFSGLPDQALMCTFVAGLPDQVKKLLQTSSRMDDLAFDQLLVHAWVIMKDEKYVDIL